MGKAKHAREQRSPSSDDRSETHTQLHLMLPAPSSTDDAEPSFYQIAEPSASTSADDLASLRVEMRRTNAAHAERATAMEALMLEMLGLLRDVHSRMSSREPSPLTVVTSPLGDDLTARLKECVTAANKPSVPEDPRRGRISFDPTDDVAAAARCPPPAAAAAADVTSPMLPSRASRGQLSAVAAAADKAPIRDMSPTRTSSRAQLTRSGTAPGLYIPGTEKAPSPPSSTQGKRKPKRNSTEARGAAQRSSCTPLDARKYMPQKRTSCESRSSQRRTSVLGTLLDKRDHDTSGKVEVLDPDIDMDVAMNLMPDKFSLPKLPSGVIHPDGSRRSAWDVCMVLLLGYVAFSVPLVIFFIDQQHTVQIAFDLFVDALFLTDIHLNFHTAFVNESGTLVNDKRLIRGKLSPPRAPTWPRCGPAGSRGQTLSASLVNPTCRSPLSTLVVLCRPPLVDPGPVDHP